MATQTTGKSTGKSTKTQAKRTKTNAKRSANSADCTPPGARGSSEKNQVQVVD